MNEPCPEDLVHCRQAIDELDRKLVALLNERTVIVEKIGQVKQHLTLGIYEPKREEQVYSNILLHNGGPLPDDAVRRIFERIIDEMRTVQKLKMLENAPKSGDETC